VVLEEHLAQVSNKSLPGSPRGLFAFFAMKSSALESYAYGNPERVAEIRQAQQANEQRREAKRPTLSLKPRDGGWSEARKRAEALFDIPPRAVLEA
jgi:hypothetical protein